MSAAPRARLDWLRRAARAERLRALAPRYLFAAAVAVLALVGLRELVAPAPSVPAADSTAAVDHAAADFAQRFARAYLTYDVAHPGARERGLRTLVPEELGSDAGLAPARGSQRVVWTEVAQNQEALAGGRLIVVAAGLDTQAEPVYLAVPVERSASGALALTGYPSLVGPPTVARAPLPIREEVDDPEIAAVVRRALANYLAGEARNLAADLAPEARVSLPTLSLRASPVDELVWTAGEGSSAVLATVEARDDSGALWTLTYEVGIERIGERTYVSFIETVPNAT